MITVRNGRIDSNPWSITSRLRRANIQEDWPRSCPRQRVDGAPSDLLLNPHRYRRSKSININNSNSNSRQQHQKSRESRSLEFQSQRSGDIPRAFSFSNNSFDSYPSLPTSLLPSDLSLHNDMMTHTLTFAPRPLTTATLGLTITTTTKNSKGVCAKNYQTTSSSYKNI